MSEFKLLVDTNVVIGLEDPQPVERSLADLVRIAAEYNVGLFVDGANYDDVRRDKDVARRSVTLSKLEKFQKLRGIPMPTAAELAARFGAINNENDLSDARLLATLDAKAVHFLVTEDVELRRRGERAGLGGSVLTVNGALEWLNQTFGQKAVHLPYVTERLAYQIPTNNAVFDSLRNDYPEFDKWFDKCRQQHRDCWVLEIEEQIAGLVIRKNETHPAADTVHHGPKILKICTFKVRDEFLGEKFGELLLKQVLWFAQHNEYDVVYLTVFPKHAFLIDLLSYYGFRQSKNLPTGELMMEKVIAKGRLPSVIGNAFEFDRLNYPRYVDGETVRKFCVPIQPEYHRRLFPEIAFGAKLPLFPKDTFGLMLSHGQERTPGNTIRKVYLCRAKITRLRPGDVLFFYMSKDNRYEASQSITTIGIVEQVVDVVSGEDLIRLTAKRSVFSAEELGAMNASESSPVKMIDFLLVGHSIPPVTLNTLVTEHIFSGRPPQSITELPGERYRKLKPHIRLGFEP
jgi:L-amino acid N-acyltransferase YncA